MFEAAHAGRRDPSTRNRDHPITSHAPKFFGCAAGCTKLRFGGLESHIWPMPSGPHPHFGSQMQSGHGTKAGVLRSLTDAVEKGFLGGSPSNIDSRRASNAQDRFKNSAPMIRLLRAGGMPGTFSTASARSGHSKAHHARHSKGVPPNC